MRTAKICALSFILCFTLSFFTPAYARSVPKLLIEEPFFQAGEVYEGASVSHDFIIQNIGDGSLHLSVSADSDLKISMPRTTLRPGTSGKISIRLQTKRLRGKVARIVELTTDDPEMPTATLSFMIIVKEIVSVTPANIDFGCTNQGEVYSKKILIGNNTTEPIVISQIITSPAEHLLLPDLRYFTLKPYQKKELTLTFMPKEFTGVLEGSLFIRTNYERLREKIVPLRAEVTANGKRIHIYP